MIQRAQPEVAGMRRAAALFALLIASTVEAQIPFPATELAEKIEHGVECYINPTASDCPASNEKPSCSFFWPYPDKQVLISRYSETQVKADIFLKCRKNNSPNPLVTMHVILRFWCNWRAPSVRVTASDVRIDIDLPGWADLLVFPSTEAPWIKSAWIEATRESERARAKFLAEGGAKLFVAERSSGLLTYCPGISVQKNGDVMIDFSEGTECKSGQSTHRACGSTTHIGPGIDYVCVGGRWGRDKGYCERKPPPGGHQN